MELTGELFRIMIYYDFKKELSAYECKESLDSTFSEQAPSLATIYRWYKEFERERNSVQHQKGSGRLSTAVTNKNIAAVKKIIKEDNKSTYGVIEHQLKIGSSAVKTIIHDQLHLKKSCQSFCTASPF